MSISANNANIIKISSNRCFTTAYGYITINGNIDTGKVLTWTFFIANSHSNGINIGIDEASEMYINKDTPLRNKKQTVNYGY